MPFYDRQSVYTAAAYDQAPLTVGEAASAGIAPSTDRAPSALAGPSDATPVNGSFAKPSLKLVAA